ncbi:MAG: hypothetical protein ACI3XS_02055 [Eubacteriales bacterium]
MKELWTTKWKKVLIWACGYISFMAFALVGGYVIVKSDDEELKKTAKLTFIVTLIFTGVFAFFSLFNYFGGMFNGYYGSVMYKIISILTSIVNIVKILTYAFFIVCLLAETKIRAFVKNSKDKKENSKKNTEEKSVKEVESKPAESTEEKPAESAEEKPAQDTEAKAEEQ